jgi:DNA-binding NarL/FixJ family response regulator
LTVRIVIADDHVIMAAALHSLLRTLPDFEVIGEAHDGRAAVEMVRQTRPDLVLMDISMPGLNGIDATRQIAAESSATKVIVLSMHIEERFVTGAFESGAAGYLLKDCSPEELVTAIRSVIANKTYVTPAAVGALLQRLTGHLQPTGKPALAPLTLREHQVLKLLSEGFETKEIAATLKVSVKTVFSHRVRIQEKLQIHSIAGLTKYALRAGITTLKDDRPL